MSPAVDGLLSSYITWGTGDSRRDPKSLFQHSPSSPPSPRAAPSGHVGQWGEDSEDPWTDTGSQGTQQFTGHVPGPAGMEQAGDPRGVRPCGAIHREKGLPTRPVRNPSPQPPKLCPKVVWTEPGGPPSSRKEVLGSILYNNVLSLLSGKVHVSGKGLESPELGMSSTDLTLGQKVPFSAEAEDTL